MPFDAVPTRSTLSCRHCGGLLGDRAGNTLHVKSLSIEFKRSALLACAECGMENTFYVDREKLDIKIT